mmetsp:Transcript_59083/g.105033  ORF Transcript_59083/g.105033 Transcript_59083/m.105033 type:complete len:243 (+) Transcript_59083:339-1067(+)
MVLDLMAVSMKHKEIQPPSGMSLEPEVRSVAELPDYPLLVLGTALLTKVLRKVMLNLGEGEENEPRNCPRKNEGGKGLPEWLNEEGNQLIARIYQHLDPSSNGVLEATAVARHSISWRLQYGCSGLKSRRGHLQKLKHRLNESCHWQPVPALPNMAWLPGSADMAPDPGHSCHCAPVGIAPRVIGIDVVPPVFAKSMSAESTPSVVVFKRSSVEKAVNPKQQAMGEGMVSEVPVHGSVETGV